ncbi:MAG: T9SS type A sorting domain-containing protein [Cytophagales bacterium]|nr:T9SS type A sorting domain-containing protein [Cytophagales bacterium]
MNKHFYLFLSLLTFGLNAYSQVLLPVEVLGKEDTIVRRKITLPNEIATATNRLWLQVNNLSYENKGSVRVNTGTWYDLNHESVQMQVPEKARGGMVHGGYNTIRFSIPANDFKEGENVIRFRFNKSDGISMGYRVIRLNLLDNQGKKLLDESYFEDDDPATWKAPFTDAQSIAEGEDLWRNADLWSNYLHPDSVGSWYAYELKPYHPIKAKCADCHAQDGRDLEMFAYSNESIIERAKFHNLSEVEGQKIASYIRSLSQKDEKIKRIGRPWNPPYQPGVELKGKPIDEWHAGAGLDAVLEEDKDMLPYLFPNGVNKEEVEKLFDQHTPDINRTELPLAIQFPDWKHWLPMIHPKDAFTKGNFYQETYDDRSEYKTPQNSRLNPEKAYEMFREYLESLPKKADGKTIDIAGMTQNQKNELIEQHENYHANSRFFMQQGQASGQHWRTKTGTAQNALDDNVPLTFANTSIARLMAVKNFEIMHEFGLQDQMPDLWKNEDFPNNRQWLHGKSHNVFEVPPHFTANQDDGGTEHFEGQSDATGHYESTTWYELQNVLGGGEGQGWWNGPVDYNYMPQFIVKASGSSGVDEPLRYYHSIKTMYKVKSWSGNIDVGDGYGFRIRQQGPWRFFGKQGRFTRNGFYDHEPGTWAYLLDEVQPGMSKLVLDALFKEFLVAVEKYPISSWPRESGNGVREGQNLGPINQSDVIDITQKITPPTDERPIWSDNIMWLIPVAQEHGVDCEIMDEFIDWCQEAWPQLNFNQFKGKSSSKVELFYEMTCDGGLHARTANVGENPNYTWWINEVKQTNNSDFLDRTEFELGDNIRVRVTGTSACAEQSPSNDEVQIEKESDCTVTNADNIEDFQEIQLRVYPNPANNNLNIEFNSTTDNIMNLDIYSVEGQLIHQATISTINGMNNHQVNTKELANGIYLIKLYDDTSVQSISVIINH